MRLDPTALPLRFFASDAAADDEMRDIELHRERVVVRRSVRGMRMALNMPVSAFSGVALKVSRDGLVVVLAHKDPGLALPLLAAAEAEDALTSWQDWGRALALPLLVEDDAGLHDAYPRLGELSIGRARPRRRRRSPLQGRRPSLLMRRKASRALGAMSVHRDEREIIARD
jgi:hypothetical protein